MGKDSTEINDEDRLKMFEACKQTPCESIIITHGTDTLIDTAAFLGKRIKESSNDDSLRNKRVCLVGAMRPERSVDTDAHFNLGVCFGVCAAAAPGVYLCMNGRAHNWDAVERDSSTGAWVPKT